MKISRADLRYLKWSLLAFSASLVIGIVAIRLGNEYLAHSLEQLQAAQKQDNAASHNLVISQSDLESISAYATDYASLLDRKIIAGEQRLDWMEAVTELRRQRHLANFKYTIAPQQPYVLPPTLNTGNLEINLSSIHLQTDLLHEVQLLNFFDALHTAKQGWFIVERCALERYDNATAPLGSQLNADCTGGWITMKHRSAS